LDFGKERYLLRLTDEKNSLLNQILPGISMARAGYPFFSEPLYDGKPDQYRFRSKPENNVQAETISVHLRSDDFAAFYPYFSMKSYGKRIPERQNIPKLELAKTAWFKEKIKALLAGAS
jgi:hypothetical protein